MPKKLELDPRLSANRALALLTTRIKDCPAEDVLRMAEAYAVLFRMVEKGVAAEEFLERLEEHEKAIARLNGQEAMSQAYYKNAQTS